MLIKCVRCNNHFGSDLFRGYCDNCVGLFKKERKKVHRAQRPSPGVFADGKFTTCACPASVYDPIRETNVCGLCGSEELDTGYGIGTGYGCGSYNFCTDCDNFLDFSEDAE
jgi:hypothetical protein